MNNERKQISYVQSAGSLLNMDRNFYEESDSKIMSQIEMEINEAMSNQHLTQIIKRNGIKVEIPDKPYFTKQEVSDILDMRYESLIPLEWYKSNQLYTKFGIYRSEDIMIQRLNAGFSFNPLKNAQIQLKFEDKGIYCRSDIFEFLNQIYKQQGYLYQPKEAFDLSSGFQYPKQVENSAAQEFYHREIYNSSWRKDFIRRCGLNDFSAQYINNSQEDYFERLKTHQLFSRLAGMACCFNDFDSAQKALEQFPNDFLPTMIAINNIKKILQIDKGDLTKFMQDQQFNNSMDFIVNEQQFKKLQNLKSLSDPSVDHILYSNITDNNQRHKILEMILQYLIKQFSGNGQLIYKDPYLVLLAGFFGMDNQQFACFLSDKNNGLNFFDKFALCLKYLDDDSLKKFMTNHVTLDSLIIIGKSKLALQILQEYLNQTNDIQLVGTLACHFYLLNYPNKKEFAYLFEEYRKILNQENMFIQRVQLEKEVQDIQKKINNQEIQQRNNNQEIQQRISNYEIASPIFEHIDKETQRTIQISQICECTKQTSASICDSCFMILPQCPVCDNAVYKEQGSYIMCIECKHGGHEKHIRDWFAEFDQCAQENCICECVIND